VFLSFTINCFLVLLSFFLPCTLKVAK
jgi:hypothetical protein